MDYLVIAAHASGLVRSSDSELSVVCGPKYI